MHIHILLFNLTDIGALLRRIPGRELLPLANAVTFVASPRSIEVEFPYGGVQDSEPPSSDEDTTDKANKRKANDDSDYNTKGTKRFKRYSKNILKDMYITVLNEYYSSCTYYMRLVGYKQYYNTVLQHEYSDMIYWL